jgi:hypothetical protein
MARLPSLLVRAPAFGALGLAMSCGGIVRNPSTPSGNRLPPSTGDPTSASRAAPVMESSVNPAAAPKVPGAWIDVNTWCAKYPCDTGADTAIDGALATLAASGGGTLFFPAGSYCVQRPIVVATDRIVLRGAGKATVLHPCTPTDGGPKERSGPPPFVIDFAASDGGVSDLTLRCDGIPGTVTSGLGVAPHGNDSRNIMGNIFSGLRIEACNANGIVLRAAKGLTVFNSFYDVFVTYSGTAIRFEPSAGGSINSNQFFAITVNNFVTTGIDIQGGRENTFFGCSFETVFGRAISIAKGSEDNRFFGTTFDNGPDTIDIVNEEPTTQFYGANTGAARVSSKAGGTFVGLGDGGTNIGGYTYSSTDGVARLNTVGGVRIQTNSVLDEGKNLAIGGGADASLSVGPRLAHERLLMPTLASFHAPASNWGPSATFVADGSGRGALILSSGFSASNNLGNTLMLSPIGVSATQSGFGAPAPVVVGGGSNIYTSWPGSGLIAKSPDGSRCALIGIDNRGNLAAKPISCP